jgi:hypothetical protein
VTSATATSTTWSINILIIPFHVPFLDDAPMALSFGECTSVLLSARNEQTAQNHMQISWTCWNLKLLLFKSSQMFDWGGRVFWLLSSHLLSGYTSW